MRTQFFYTRKEAIEGKKEEFKSFLCSFNVNKVIRSEELENGNILILLDDLHKRWEDVPVEGKTGRVISHKREENTFQSEIYLTENDDIQRFRDISSITPIAIADYSSVIEHADSTAP